MKQVSFFTLAAVPAAAIKTDSLIPYPTPPPYQPVSTLEDFMGKTGVKWEQKVEDLPFQWEDVMTQESQPANVTPAREIYMTEQTNYAMPTQGIYMTQEPWRTNVTPAKKVSRPPLPPKPSESLASLKAKKPLPPSPKRKKGPLPPPPSAGSPLPPQRKKDAKVVRSFLDPAKKDGVASSEKEAWGVQKLQSHLWEAGGFIHSRTNLRKDGKIYFVDPQNQVLSIEEVPGLKDACKVTAEIKGMQVMYTVNQDGYSQQETWSLPERCLVKEPASWHSPLTWFSSRS